jgi:hypothetical protein
VVKNGIDIFYKQDHTHAGVGSGEFFDAACEDPISYPSTVHLLEIRLNPWNLVMLKKPGPRVAMSPQLLEDLE